MTRWEYQRVVTDGDPPIGLLNDLGARGWELCERTVSPVSPGQLGKYVWLFKRPLLRPRPALETKDTRRAHD